MARESIVRAVKKDARLRDIRLPSAARISIDAQPLMAPNGGDVMLPRDAGGIVRGKAAAGGKR